MVRESGLYYLSAAELAPYFQISVADMKELISHRRLAMRNRGLQIAWKCDPNQDGIYFYGEALDSPYAVDNVYWLAEGKGMEMTLGSSSTVPPAAGDTFNERLHFEEETIAALVVATDPESDYWYWDTVIADDPTLGSRTFDLEVADPSPSHARAELSIQLYAIGDLVPGYDHRLQVRFNGFLLGTAEWDGEGTEVVSFTVAPSLLLDGTNSVELTGLLNPSSTFSGYFVDHFDLAYVRKMMADNDALQFPAERYANLTVSGFSTADIVALDIGRPSRPVWRDALAIDFAGTYRAGLSVAGKTTYLMTTLSAARNVDAIVADTPSQLKAHHGSQHVIITAREFAQGAAELADYQRDRGLSSFVAYIDDVYDEFSDGIPNPWAISEFIEYAIDNWREDPGYFVLAGNGTFDYKNNQGLGDNFVPAVLIGTRHGLAPSDNLLADVRGGDGVPEVAIGRVPALTNADLEQYVDKLQFQAPAGAQSGAISLLLADDGDEAGNFALQSDNAAVFLPASFSQHKVYLDHMTMADARTDLQLTWQAGVDLVNFVGHAGPSQLAHGVPGLLETR